MGCRVTRMYLAFEASTGYGGSKTFMKRFPAIACLLLLALSSSAETLFSVPGSDLVFTFKEPTIRRYHAAIGRPGSLGTSDDAQWIRVTAKDVPGREVELGRRLLITPGPGQSAQVLLQDQPVRLGDEVLPNTWIAEAPDAWFAADTAERISRVPGVIACHPILRYLEPTHASYAALPNDPYFPRQWHLENRISTGARAGADLNVRAAWPVTRGADVLAAIVDDGVELTHPDLADRFAGGPHFNFSDQTSNGGQSTPTASHSTAVAGILGATGGNNRGVSGVAPDVKMTSWVIFQGSFLGPDTFGMKQMFEFGSHIVDVQNHSWGAGGTEFYPLPPMEDLGINNAVTNGRGGKGVVIVRASSNFRGNLADANADGYAADPRVIVVAAARSDGRVTRYSNPGACVLVGGLGGETDAASGQTDPSFPSITTTDLTGLAGKNQIFSSSDEADYRYDTTGFSGTSAATPMISGIVSLILSANPTLSVRDVQQVLLLSSRHLDLNDPTLQTNAAGLRVGRNLGYGIPDAEAAVRLAKGWKLRPALETVTLSFPAGQAIIEDGLRLEVTGQNIPTALASVPVSTGTGIHPDFTTASFPVTSIGLGSGTIATSLKNQAALILRGLNTFTDKLRNAANAGASLALVYNNSGTTDRMVMQNTDFSSIPAVFLSKTAGDLLAQVIQTNASAQVRINPLKTITSIDVTNSMLCEYVGVFLRTDHTRRGDLRITLVSPSGTRSVLQAVNQEARAFPASGWTYQSAHHFYEQSAGRWTLELMDEESLNTGTLLEAKLILRGVTILDSDRDGLDDAWEMAQFGSLSAAAKADPDIDGVSNAIEQILQTDPKTPNLPFRLELDRWNNSVVRLSWPGIPGGVYQISRTVTPDKPFVPVNVIEGSYPFTEWMLPLDGGSVQLYRVERLFP